MILDDTMIFDDTMILDDTMIRSLRFFWLIVPLISYYQMIACARCHPLSTFDRLIHKFPSINGASDKSIESYDSNILMFCRRIGFIFVNRLKAD